ncbi:MAG: glutamyl-tRNA reductase [Eubacterium sp.]|nr:glutamyl-tRNA reductase [Eubacterium sp.]
MQFGVCGINYKKADLDIRDKTSFTDLKKAEFFQLAGNEGIEQCMVLSTCNRSEVYFLYETEAQFDRVCRVYERMFSEALLGEYMIAMGSEAAMGYLFRVAAGLESLVLGEDQILGQVKEALDFSRTMGYDGKELNKIVRDAITCAKRIKTEFKISEKPLSVSYIGIRMVEEHTGIAGKRVLLIGSGKASLLALKYLKEYGAGKITVCSRTFSHAGRLQEEEKELQVIPYEERYPCMAQCDIVVSATASPHTVVRREDFEPEGPITFLDLAAPRDIDTAFMEHPLVYLINLDTLQKIAEENRRQREQLVEESQDMLQEALEETRQWILQSRVDDTIQSLQHRCNHIVEDSFTYLDRKMELSHREQKILKKVLNASLQRLLREPIQELKQLDSKEKQDEYKKMVNELFHI